MGKVDGIWMKRYSSGRGRVGSQYFRVLRNTLRAPLHAWRLCLAWRGSDWTELGYCWQTAALRSAEAAGASEVQVHLRCPRLSSLRKAISGSDVF